MGTPRASASADQMRNVQRTACLSGECPTNSRFRQNDCSVAVRTNRESSSVPTGMIRGVNWYGAEAAAACCNGFCCGKAQLFIVAQQSPHFSAGCGIAIPHASAGA